MRMRLSLNSFPWQQPTKHTPSGAAAGAAGAARAAVAGEAGAAVVAAAGAGKQSTLLFL